MLALPALALACGGDDGDEGNIFDTVGELGTSATTGADEVGDSGESESSSESSSGGESDSEDSTGSAEGGPKLDTLPPDTGIDDGPIAENCSAVDLLFVVDNSVSMSEYQEALALAFPAFADTMLDVLPAGVSLHVGVTSTTMGMSNSGQTTNCVAVGDNDQPVEAFYETPDMSNNMINGAQGRLYDPGDGVTYFETSTDAGPQEVAELKAWFSDAAKIGESGSQIEMLSAGAGWVADPANDATNAGFVRDNGAVLVLFFLQDEPDQTPGTIDGQAGGLAMLDKLVATKPVCGGADCIIGGGYINQFCLAQTPVGDLLGNLGADPIVEELPGGFNPDPQMVSAEMQVLFEETLSQAIAAKCEEIVPVG